MGEIKIFGEEHSEEVAELYLRVMRGRRNAQSQRLAAYFRHIFLHYPWRQVGYDSLMYIDGSRIVGFLGMMRRPMHFAGREINVAVYSQFMMDREAHRGMGAIALFRKCVAGSQELNFTDGSAEGSAKVWAAVGGEKVGLYSFNWLRTLRPVATIQEHTTGRLRGGVWTAINGAVGLLGAPIDAVAQRFLRPTTPYETVAVDSAALFETITDIGWREKLKPSYQRESFNWLIAEASQAKYGQFRLRVTREQDGKACGWFVYYLKPGGVCYVLQIGARRADQYRGVLRALFADAADGGGTCVKGQSQPRHLVDLTEEHCLFRHPNSSVLIASRDPELKAAIHRGDAALTRLDGESWLRFSVEDWLKPY